MNEAFLHFLWQFQYFDKSCLQTTDNESLQVIKIGNYNTNAGADFQDARVLIGEVEWAGAVEIHLKSSDWNLHEHQTDTAYQNVILHVVWEDDKPILRSDNTKIPTLILSDKTDNTLTQKYFNLIESKALIPCQSQFGQVSELKKMAMLDKVLMQRLATKSSTIHELLTQNKQDWEETAYQVLAKNFGFKLNAEPFIRLAQNLPLKVLSKHRDNLFQIEALLFGVAGFLTVNNVEVEDEYQSKLAKEFQFLAAKYQLQEKVLGLHEWKFLRLRPANFPTVRLAQFAKIIQENINLFSVMLYLENVANVTKIMRVKQSAYWQEHYLFGKKANGKVAIIGESSIENIIINTIIPLLVTYSQQKDDARYIEKAIRFLEELPAEENKITKHWQSLALPMKSAFDSQAGIEWFNVFCQYKKCLSCEVGISLLREKL
ncbi:DUF2851 family protein [Arcicella rosea]|uniref:DUF2851 domain-containing protein n=1 Tax=Arcicella rosea TaxID=502909 RepID=A0A841EQK4_9BACT|nr:DUF2851 family protein [Arcicella rosea]MBB6003649.1 hypothetical protein [Arcicella rosea]